VDLAPKLRTKFECNDFLLKECEFEAKGTHSVDEMMKLVEAHTRDEHRTLKLSPETIEKIRSDLEKRTRS
jgi:predicted small metal-binding protein